MDVVVRHEVHVVYKAQEPTSIQCSGQDLFDVPRTRGIRRR
jgi:hypothetical protein